MSTEFDIAIIGGGNAGLTLAAQLAAHDNPPSTVVIEPQPMRQRDCSWALWALDQQSDQLTHSIKGRWRRWQLIDETSRVVHSSNQFSYLSLSSADYLVDCAAQLREPVSLIEDSVKALHPQQHETIIETEQSRYSAKTVYDSRPPKVAYGDLRQHFLGWQVTTKEPIKEPDIATLMDFRVDQSRGLHFIYALPFSDHHLLIESTLISGRIETQDWYRDAIKGWLRDNNIEIDEFICEEVGVIPMDTLRSETHPAASPTSPEPKPLIATIGAASGAVRRSSGYAFQHIQQQISQLAAGIAQGHMLVPSPISSYLTAMDSIFNGVLQSRPDLAVSLYMKMAHALNGDQFARFMLGQATASDWLRVIAAMPKGPFVKETLKQAVKKSVKRISKQLLRQQKNV
ncbi:lycopene cyclase family protein [Gammaproteobacteria bacterium MOLA455]|nr:lycopene cyclase family protein [Gammaproteobacteria bacterium MOLA455]